MFDDLGSAPIEERRLQLERERFDFEKSKSYGISGFINNNISVIITAIIGVATITVSAIQLYITSTASDKQLLLQQQSGDKQIALQKEISASQIAVEREKFEIASANEEKRFQYDMARLLLERKADIDTSDAKDIVYMREVVVATLPPDVGARIMRRMAENAIDDRSRQGYLDSYINIKLNAGNSTDFTVRTLKVQYIISKFPQLNTPEKQQRLDDLIGEIEKSSIKDIKTKYVLISLILYNTTFFDQLEENLKYTTPERILAVFGNSIGSRSDALKLVNNPEGLANVVYKGRLGNRDDGDGWTYRGRGYLQTSGRGNYQASSLLTGLDLITTPDLLLQSKIAAKEAVAFFIKKDVGDNPQDAVRKVNGGMAGLAGVQSIYEILATGAPQLTKGLDIPPNEGGGGG